MLTEIIRQGLVFQLNPVDHSRHQDTKEYSNARQACVPQPEAKGHQQITREGRVPDEMVGPSLHQFLIIFDVDMTRIAAAQCGACPDK